MDLVTQFKTWWASIAEKEKSGLMVLGMFFLRGTSSNSRS